MCSSDLLADLLLKAETIKADTGVNLVPQITALGQRTFGLPSPDVSPVQPAPVAVPTVAPAPVSAPAPVAAPAPTAIPGYAQASPENPAVLNESVPLKFRNELRASQPAVLKASIQAVREIRDLRDTAEKLLANEMGLKSAVGKIGRAHV